MNVHSLDERRVEYKYCLDPVLAAEVRQWAKHHLHADAHCDLDQGDSYDIHTLYLDTEAWDLYQRTDAVGKSKHRVRRYGRSDSLWLETKKKDKHSVVSKRRVALTSAEWLARLQQAGRLQQFNPLQDADGEWFFERVHQRALRPAVNVHYRRFARMLELGHQPIRLTIDSHLESSLPLADGNICDRPTNEKRPFGSLEILELKFNGMMPDLFKELLETFPLQATGFSKFRSAVDALGLVPQAPVLRIDTAIENQTVPAPMLIQLAPTSLGESA